MTYDVVIVGGGASGLTAAAYLCKLGRRVLLCEKEASCGGLVNSFERDGFVFDGGIRALENAGVLFPMLRQLGVSMDFVKNHISMGIEEQVIAVESDESLADYRDLLVRLYPHAADEIAAITDDLRLIMHFMDIQYGIDNPLFMDPKKDRDFFIKEVLPWMVKFALTSGKVMASEPAGGGLPAGLHAGPIAAGYHHPAFLRCNAGLFCTQLYQDLSRLLLPKIRHRRFRR